MSEEDAVIVSFDQARAVARYDPEDDTLTWTDATGLPGTTDRVELLGVDLIPVSAFAFVVGPEALANKYVQSRTVESSARFGLPSLNIDDEETFKFAAYFVTSVDPALVLLTGTRPVPLALVRWIVKAISDDLRYEAQSESLSRWTNLARRLDGILRRALGRRIRRIEDSVRTALSDESLSDQDYGALRSYADRLARVERLWSDIDDPTWKGYGAPTVALAVQAAQLERSPTTPATDARDAMGRLSGLISSQAVVVARRQAYQTERFQRLVTVVGAAVLVPGLVAAVFGANVGFRGQNTTHGFWAMLLLMASGGLGSYVLLRSHELAMWSSSRRPRDSETATDPEAKAWVWFGAAATFLGAAAGFWILLGTPT